MTHRRRLLAVLVTTAGSLAACASSATAPARVEQRAADRAATPQAAALAFHRDWTAIGTPGKHTVTRYSCMTAGYYSSVSSGLATKPYVSAVAHRGTAWVVSVADRSQNDPDARYRVRFDHGGYCVDEVLGESSLPSSPSS